MTAQDEARELLRRKSAAEDDLAAIRRQIDEVVFDGGGHIDAATADDFARQLEATQERVRAVKLALALLNAG